MIDLDAVFGDESGPAPVAVAPEPEPEPIDDTSEPIGLDEYEWGDAIDPGEPCEVCGGLTAWQDLAGGWHCQRCNAAGLMRSLALATDAERLRTRYTITL